MAVGRVNIGGQNLREIEGFMAIVEEKLTNIVNMKVESNEDFTYYIGSTSKYAIPPSQVIITKYDNKTGETTSNVLFISDAELMGSLLLGSNLYIAFFAVNEPSIYNIDTNTLNIVSSTNILKRGGQYLTTDGQYLYCSEIYSPEYFKIMDLDTLNVINSRSDLGRAVHYHDNHFYGCEFVGSNSTELYVSKYNMDGGRLLRTQKYSGTRDKLDLHFSGNFMYIKSSGYIYKVDLDTFETLVMLNDSGVMKPKVHNNKLYVARTNGIFELNQNTLETISECLIPTEIKDYSSTDKSLFVGIGGSLKKVAKNIFI